MSMNGVAKCKCGRDLPVSEIEKKVRDEIARLEPLVKAGPGAENPNWAKYVSRLWTLRWVLGELT